ncbi:tRNA uridine-5-carboxymethylaminomethyl(34) synthesis GTPase MnmE [Flavisphingomonas formosensis]|uniref:tRNA uridine-5-carboxymethylaminomethyl(34) synthesis GTPase MnmE n=1 Tax=Flavisphingomonas formosensis TaxID=861534 RepID=UPI0012FBCE4A|nr:tRNA uridine-5-carboxymethylaminomethyl(34) synthesis GTPase MnmE [Sphingomonas formosensis]
MSGNNRRDTIFALSSGAPPSGIAVIRISGPAAGPVLEDFSGSVPRPRFATLRRISDPASGLMLDHGLVLWFPGPHSATGEDLAELHLHGGRGVVAAVLRALAGDPRLSPAEAGEFTRRAFENGRIDLAEAEGLADLLAAETESQRRAALAMAEGGLSRQIEYWRRNIVQASARIEAMLDFADEDDVPAMDEEGRAEVLDLSREMRDLLDAPSAERLRDGIRVAIAGPPNTGKSTLLNAIVGREAAITSAIPGTTRDVIEAPVAIGAIPFLFSDTAGLRASEDEIERIGVERAHAIIAAADIVLWLDDSAPPDDARFVALHPRIDIEDRKNPAEGRLGISAATGEGMAALLAQLVRRAESLIPAEGEIALNARQRGSVADAVSALELCTSNADPLIVAEALRLARAALDRVTGRAGVEDMLDALFGRFCIGK